MKGVVDEVNIEKEEKITMQSYKIEVNYTLLRSYHIFCCAQVPPT